ncbi:transcriptional regulator [Sulfolobus sp. S-194]|uniref:helix-turn-helix transcriptional regulator n=1 Tax=Sulfolobus sp. S-194 TaxID=2512240 RepID=UPI001436F1EA|nr:transcriptional regulator [Sulfolobus sp. S-194]QIW25152.1 transcriptional regulator [Sulfolobus sp. S-194]
MRKFVILLLIPIIGITLIMHSSVYMTIYYNDSVIIHVYNQTQIYLPVQNYSTINSTSPFRIVGNLVILNYPNSTLSYKTSIKNEIRINEPYNITVSVIIPDSTYVTYISTLPTSVTVNNNLLNLTFYTSNLTLIYASNLTTSGNNSFYSLLLLVTFVLSLISTGILSFLLFRNLKRGRIEEPILVSGLDERDKLILEAISKGADSIAKISKLTGLSRATVYRRVKRLINLGYVKEIREGNKIRYEENKKE